MEEGALFAHDNLLPERDGARYGRKHLTESQATYRTCLVAIARKGGHARAEKLSTVATITDAEWQELNPDNFETASLLRAVDSIDEARDYLNDGDHCNPPQLRTDLLKLHGLAMGVFDEGSRSQVAKMFEMAVDIEDEVDSLLTLLEQVRETLSELTALYPESLSYAD